MIDVMVTIAGKNTNSISFFVLYIRTIETKRPSNGNIIYFQLTQNRCTKKNMYLQRLKMTTQVIILSFIPDIFFYTIIVYL